MGSILNNIKYRMINKSLFLGILLGIIIAKPLFSVWNKMYFEYYAKDKYLSRASENIQPPPIKGIDDTTDDDWTIKLGNGQEISQADFEGKVVFLNFWASWCIPCLAEMPSIQSLHEKIKDDKFLMLCLSDEDDSEIKAFVSKNNYTFPIHSVLGELPGKFEVGAIPKTFIISKKGKIAFSHSGSAKWDADRSLEFINGLLQEQ